MGTKSVITTDRLYWLGRYTERVYTTLRVYQINFDKLIEQNVIDYADACNMLEIPNIYKDKDDFIARYAFDTEDPNSIISNLMRAYDNGIELREEIGSEALAYIQLAVYSMQKAKTMDGPMVSLQAVMDNILAFWGIADDQIDDEDTRHIIKVGRRVERLDLNARLHVDRFLIEKEADRLISIIKKDSVKYNKDNFEKISNLIIEKVIDYKSIVTAVENLVEA